MRSPHQRSCRTGWEHGFTLVELMVTLAVLAILLSIAAPAMSRFVTQWQVSNATNAFTGSLRTARTEAIARARPVVMCRVDTNTSTTCLSSVGTNGFASGWIVFVNNDNDTSFNFNPDNGDELLLRQYAPTGIADITPKTAGRFVYLPNGLLNSNANSVNIDSHNHSSAAPWTRKGICISKAGQVKHVADNVDCGG